MNVLIIVPRFRERDQISRLYFPILTPMGLAYISSSLKQNGFRTDFLNLNLCDGTVENAIDQALSGKEYRFMLTGGLSTHYSAVKNCVSLVREYSPHTQIVLGGGLVSSQPELISNALRPDYLVIGEGENTIVELLHSINDGGDPSRVDGIGYMSSKGQFVLTKPRKPIQDIDSIPWPDYEGIGWDAVLDQTLPSQSYVYDMFDHPRPYPLVASRSCPYLCSFCFHPIGNKYRQRSIPNIMAELKFALGRYQFNIIEVYDELFSRDKQRVLEFCQGLQELSKNVSWPIKWNCQMRVDTTDEELIKILKGAGVHCLSLGLESYSRPVLKSMNKHITPQQIDKTLRSARRFELAVQGNFIFSDKAETVETAKETLDYWKENYDLFGASIALGFIEPYPGTALYKHCLTKGLISDELDFLENHILDPINMSETMTEEEFQQLKIDIRTAYILHDKFVSPSKINKINGLYEVHVKCPYCKIVSVYGNYAPPTGERKDLAKRGIVCRNCSMRFWLVTRHYEVTHLLGRLVYRIIGYKGSAYLRSKLHILEGFFYVRKQ